MFCREPEEPSYHCTKSMAIASFSFSTQHCWLVITPFWLLADDMLLGTLLVIQYCTNTSTYKCTLAHPRTGFIFRRIKSLFHHSNWQHIFLISFNGTSKRGVMHYKFKKNIKFIWFFGQTLPICMRNSGISIIKSIANLKISLSFFIRKNPAIYSYIGLW